jgi:hypothetical protein
MSSILLNKRTNFFFDRIDKIKREKLKRKSNRFLYCFLYVRRRARRKEMQDKSLTLLCMTTLAYYNKD